MSVWLRRGVEAGVELGDCVGVRLRFMSSRDGDEEEEEPARLRCKGEGVGEVREGVRERETRGDEVEREKVQGSERPGRGRRIPKRVMTGERVGREVGDGDKPWGKVRGR